MRSFTKDLKSEDSLRILTSLYLFSCNSFSGSSDRRRGNLAEVVDNLRQKKNYVTTDSEENDGKVKTSICGNSSIGEYPPFVNGHKKGYVRGSSPSCEGVCYSLIFFVVMYISNFTQKYLGTVISFMV